VSRFYQDGATWDAMSCDETPEFAALNIADIMEEGTQLFVVASIDDRPAGLFMFSPENFHCYSIHSALLPEFQGLGKAHELGLAACLWVCQHTPCIKITTVVPSFNEIAQRMAMKAGMRLEGCNRASFVKRGRLYDQFFYGLTKDEVISQCQ
jgi:RimJ/RimL family protein N-acetyltransferase